MTKTYTKEEVMKYCMDHTIKFDNLNAPPDTLKIKRLRGETPDLPTYATKLSAGMDLRADFSGLHSSPAGEDKMAPLRIAPGSYILVPTGLSMELPEGYEAQVRSRSGLAIKHGVAVLNSPGTIDADYRGEVGVILVNHGWTDFVINHGDRIAQLVIARVAQLPIKEVKDLSDTERGSGGFGHSGVK